MAKICIPPCVLVLCLAAALAAQPPQGEQMVALKGLSLKQLGQIQVTTASKEPEEVWNTPAAVYVLTAAEIRRSGSTSVPDALRLVPGVEVARINASQWAIGVRGFNGQFSQNVLVLIDGRSVYTPVFGGVFWDVQNVPLDSIERIEVVRGPGATVWGANAANGVINIITKNAHATQGAYASIGGGNLDQGLATLRFGGSTGSKFAYRAYATGLSRAPEHHTDNNNFDRFRMAQGGFRMDWGEPGSRDTVSLEGDTYTGDVGILKFVGFLSPPHTVNFRGDWDVQGGNVNLHWHHYLADGSDFQVRAYYARTRRVGVNLGLTRDTYDADFIYHRGIDAWGARNEVTVGGGVRISPGTFTQLWPTINLTPHHQDDNLYSAFLQDQVTLVPHRVQLTVGSKFEHNIYTGWETEPTARLLYTPTPTQSLWAAVTRAVSIPSRLSEEFDLTVAEPNPTVYLSVLGNPNLASQNMLGYEIGYRRRVGPHVYLDVASFYNRYNQVPGFNVTTARGLVPLPHIQINEQYVNNIAGSSKGGEIAPDWQPVPWLRLRASYSYAILNLHLLPGFTNASSLQQDEGSTPRNEASAMAMIQFPHGFALDPTYRYVGALPAYSIPAYNTVDLRFACHITPKITFSLVGQNLLQPYHYEFASGDQTPTIGIRRTAFAQITWHQK